jgi:hypothetical protein
MGKTYFVFGSNLQGIHGAGSAKEAYKHWGAQWGRGVGPSGRSYAIPTKLRPSRGSQDVLAISEISKYVNEFIGYARSHPDDQFNVVRIGCGLAGFKDEQMAPLFRDAPINCVLPDEWKTILA